MGTCSCIAAAVFLLIGHDFSNLDTFLKGRKSNFPLRKACNIQHLFEITRYPPASAVWMKAAKNYLRDVVLGLGLVYGLHGPYLALHAAVGLPERQFYALTVSKMLKSVAVLP